MLCNKIKNVRHNPSGLTLKSLLEEKYTVCSLNGSLMKRME